MSDGREEREEIKERLERERVEKRDEGMDREEYFDPWEPERVDS